MVFAKRAWLALPRWVRRWAAVEVLALLIFPLHGAVAAAAGSAARMVEDRRGPAAMQATLWNLAAMFGPDSVGLEESALWSAAMSDMGARDCKGFERRARAAVSHGADAHFVFRGLAHCAAQRGDVNLAIVYYRTALWAVAYQRGGTHPAYRSLASGPDAAYGSAWTWLPTAKADALSQIEVVEGVGMIAPQGTASATVGQEAMDRIGSGLVRDAAARSHGLARTYLTAVLRRVNLACGQRKRLADLAASVPRP